jgi:hypothetical protein
MRREAQDYIGSKSASQHLVRKIRDYYANRGARNVHVWVEEFRHGQVTFFQIRSNLMFEVPNV